MGVQCLTLFFPTRSWGQDLSSGLILSKELSGGHANYGNEYVSGDYPGAILMKVNLWGPVGKSGIHFVPNQTDLVTLLSYAGGPTDSANLSDVRIKRWSGGQEKLITVDVSDLVRETGKESPMLEANDIVVIPTKKPLVSQDTSALIAVISSVLTIVSVSLLLARSK